MSSSRAGTNRRLGLDRRAFLGLAAGLTGGAAVPWLSACSLGGRPPAERQGDRTTTINALFMQQAGYSESDVRAMTAAFESKHPGITVMPSFVSYEALHDKIVAAAPAGGYDVVLMDVIWPAEFAAKRIVADVTGRYHASWKRDMFTGAMQTAEYAGTYYGVPWILDTKYLYANTAHLARAKVEPGSLATWSGVVDAARKLKAEGVAKYPLVWSWAQAEAIMCDYTQLLGAFGGRLLDHAGRPAFNTGGGVAALEFMQQTLRDGLSNPASVE